MEPGALAALVAPAVIGWLCAHEAQGQLAALAAALGTHEQGAFLRYVRGRRVLVTQWCLLLFSDTAQKCCEITAVCGAVRPHASHATNQPRNRLAPNSYAPRALAYAWWVEPSAAAQKRFWAFVTQLMAPLAESSGMEVSELMTSLVRANAKDTAEQVGAKHTSCAICVGPS
jgi:hypothetical protein